MQVVYNNEWGCFDIPDNLQYLIDEYSVTDFTDHRLRQDAKLIQWAEKHPNGWSKDSLCYKLKVANLPDEITDYVFFDYDGMETIYYVLDGKIHEYKEED